MLIKSILIVPCFVIGSFAMLKTNKVIDNTSNDKFEASTELSLISSHETLVPAILYENEIIPNVMLQTVEIKPEIDLDHLVKAIRIGDEIIPTVELKEIVVRPS